MKGQNVRVLLCVDMEGIAQITDYRQLWPEFPDSWESGRAATAIELAAAAQGLKRGGATTITICELHGATPDATIVDRDLLPDDVNWAEGKEFQRSSRLAADHDVMFLLGWHSRCGTPNGFMSHTAGRNMRVAVDGKPVTEVHINAWRAEIPIIGVTGDEALGGQMDGGLEEVPFLAVKRSADRASASPIYSAEETPPAIEAFGRWSAERAAERTRLPISERFVLTMSMPPALADEVDGLDGMQRTSPAIVARSVTDWWYEAEPAVARAMRSSFAPLGDDNADIETRRAFFKEWAEANEAEWLT